MSQIPVTGARLRCEGGTLSPVPAGQRCPRRARRVPAPSVPPSCSTQGFTRKPSGAGQLCREGEKPKQIGACFFFFALPAQLPAAPLSSPLECVSKFLAASLRAAAGFASDCLQRLRFSHTPDHGSGSPWLRAGSASPPAQCASAGRGEAQLREPAGAAGAAWLCPESHLSHRGPSEPSSTPAAGARSAGSRLCPSAPPRARLRGSLGLDQAGWEVERSGCCPLVDS